MHLEQSDENTDFPTSDGPVYGDFEMPDNKLGQIQNCVRIEKSQSPTASSDIKNRCDTVILPELYRKCQNPQTSLSDQFACTELKKTTP